MEIYEKIRTLRELNKWSQEYMAEKLGMTAGGYARIERGEVQLTINRLEQLAKIFQIDMWELLQPSRNGIIFQINEGDSGGDISLSASTNFMELELLKQELKFQKELLIQKDKEIELLKKVIELKK